MLQLEQIRRNLRQILKLTLPITTSFVAMGIMGIVDTMIVGNYQTDQLAYIGLANSVFVVLFTIPIGLLQGVLIKSSQKFGARKFASCGKIYNEGRRYLIVLSVIFTLIGFNGELVLRLLGQNEDMVTHGGRVLRVFVVSIPFILIYVNANFFLQSIKRPYVAMYGIIVANILNIMINPVLVYGKFGLPELGAVGSATSTLIVRIFLALYMLYYIKRMKKNPKQQQGVPHGSTYFPSHQAAHPGMGYPAHLRLYRRRTAARPRQLGAAAGDRAGRAAGLRGAV